MRGLVTCFVEACGAVRGRKVVEMRPRRTDWRGRFFRFDSRLVAGNVVVVEFVWNICWWTGSPAAEMAALASPAKMAALTALTFAVLAGATLALTSDLTLVRAPATGCASGLTLAPVPVTAPVTESVLILAPATVTAGLASDLASGLASSAPMLMTKSCPTSGSLLNFCTCSDVMSPIEEDAATACFLMPAKEC